MSNTYKETVLPVRVFRGLNDDLRNPNRDKWSLHASFNSYADACEYVKEERELQAEFSIQDLWKIVDTGETTTIERQCW